MTDPTTLRPKSNLLVRGGQQESDPFYNDDQSQPPYSYAVYDETTTPNYEDGFANVNAPAMMNDQSQLFQESVQERVDKWRQAGRPGS